MQRNGFNYAVETHHGNHPKQCISETEREVGFYRHDQWGLLALLTRFSNGVFNEGGSLLFRFHFYRQTTIKGGNISTMHKHMVEGWNLMYMLLMCEAIPFKWSILQVNCKFKLQFELKWSPYALFSLFTQVNLFKHENNFHIQNPWIFLIISDILFAIFGVRMNIYEFPKFKPFSGIFWNCFK